MEEDDQVLYIALHLVAARCSQDSEPPSTGELRTDYRTARNLMSIHKEHLNVKKT